MFRLRTQNQVPYFGWKWRCVDPRCPVEVAGRDEDEMVMLAALHCKANEIPVGMEFHEQVIDQMCRQYQEAGYDICKEKGRVATFVRKAKLALHQATVGTATLATWIMKHGGSLVDDEEANRRAKICLLHVYEEQPKSRPGCIHHVTVDGCQGCKGSQFRAMVEKCVGNRGTPITGRLEVCGVCGCALKAKVFFPIEVLHAYMPDDWNQRLPDFCWAKKLQ